MSASGPHRGATKRYEPLARCIQLRRTSCSVSTPFDHLLSLFSRLQILPGPPGSTALIFARIRWWPCRMVVLPTCPSYPATVTTRVRCLRSDLSTSRSSYYIRSSPPSDAPNACRTDEETRVYLSSLLFSNSNASSIDRLLELYLDDVSTGSPFDTGDENAITPEYKRLAAIIGDLKYHVRPRLPPA